jgi:clan AA aspartic protease (TIGR02281 family)
VSEASSLRCWRLLALVLAFGTAHAESIPLVREHGTFVVPVVINDSITLNFTVDSGASDVSIPADVFSTLTRAGTVSPADFLDTQVYELADGTKQSSQRFRIRSLKIGGQEVRNVTASVAPQVGALLLGQSFLSRLKSWSIDNARQVLVINELPIRNPASTMSVRPHTSPRGTVSDNAMQEAQWVSLGSFNGGKLEDFVDVSGIRIDGDVRRAWIRAVFVPHTVHGFD